MPRITYVEKNFTAAHLQIIEHANTIFAEYGRQGYELTLRQVYYQFVARGLLDQLGFAVDPHSGSTNNQRSYKKLGDVLNDARLAGQVDWDHMTDRTRRLETRAHWRDPSQIIAAVADQYRIDKWATQPRRIELWVEKDALVGVFQRICEELDIPYLSCRGYTSQSEMWSAGHERLRPYIKAGQQPLILHFGDHDPSGIDMTRDIQERLSQFARGDVELRRLALNMDQVEEYDPPPNPAKVTDSRAEAYIAEHGEESWELDALEPAVLADLVRDEVAGVRDDALWQAAVEEEDEHRRLLQAVSDDWDELTAGL